MTLTLRAVSLNDQPLTQPITAHFAAEGGSVGRGDHNTLALPDPERHISRHHAEISVSGSGYEIRNVGSSNPIIVRGQALARGESAPLAHRDQVRIGGYLLEVIHDALADAEADTVVRGRAAVDASTPGVHRRVANPQGAANAGLGDLGAPLSAGNPFADLLGDPVPAAGGRTATAASPAHALLPEDFDPFAPLEPGPPVRAAAPARGPEDQGPFGDLVPGAAPASIDDLFKLRADARDPLADFMAGVAVPEAGARAQDARARPSTDPLALFGDPSPPEAAVAAPASDHVPELHAAFIPPVARRAPQALPSSAAIDEVAAPVAAPAALAREAWQGHPNELWAALCEGAGISVQPQQGINPELMRVVGSLLRAAVAGTLQLMAVRASAKHELRAEVTMIQARNNNPLKFSPDACSALEQMLQPPMRGFLAGPAAMTDAMHDLVGHAIGTMAGTRAALEGVLDRFMPQQLEAKLTASTVLDSLLPMNRKAKLWTLYLQHFEAIRNEAQDDFHSLFGRAFLAAYEQQLDRLQRDEAVGS